MHFPFDLFLQPPIQVFGTEGRYATALYSAASKKSQLDKVEKELSSLQVILENIKWLIYHNIGFVNISDCSYS